MAVIYCEKRALSRRPVGLTRSAEWTDFVVLCWNIVTYAIEIFISELIFFKSNAKMIGILIAVGFTRTV